MKRLGNLVALVLMLSFCVCWGSAAVSAEHAPRWKTGESWQRALASRFETVAWPEAGQLREQLQRLARWQQVAVFLDRRIDPGQAVSLSARDVTLAELLDRVAAEVGGITSYVGAVVYMGPRPETGGLSQAARQRSREAESLPAGRGSRFLRQRSWRWDELAEPRELLAELADEAGIAIRGIEEIPHDLWPETDLPRLSWTDRMTIVLAGFGKTFEFEDQGRAVRLVPLPSGSLVQRQYRTTLSQVDLARVIEQFPDGVIERSEGSVTLRGTLEEHERLRELLTRQTAPSGSRGKPRTVHSLRVQQQPIGAILKALERQLGLQLQIDRELEADMQTRVTFDVQDVSLDELLQSTLEPASLTHRYDGDVIRIEKR